MSVKLTHIILSALFLFVQTHDIKASDNSLQEEQKQSKSTSAKESTKSTKASDSSLAMTTSTKTKRNKTSPSVASPSSSSQPAEAVVDALLKGTSLPKRENFVVPSELDIYETLLVLFAGQDKSKNNKIYFVDKGLACSLSSLETGTTLELEAFLYAAKVKEHAGFEYLKKMFLIENPKAEKVITKAEKISKGDQTQLIDIEKAREDIKTARMSLGYLLTDAKPGDYKDKNLLNVTAKYDVSEKRPHSTIADHNSHQAKYYLYVDDVQTKFSFWLNLYRMKVK